MLPSGPGLAAAEIDAALAEVNAPITANMIRER
jgi:hypothetical protein